MALEFICSKDIVRDERILVPTNKLCKKANCFKTVSGKIKFFISNPIIVSKMKEIPSEAKEINFIEYERHAYNIYYGNPNFYDSKGELLEIF